MKQFAQKTGTLMIVLLLSFGTNVCAQNDTTAIDSSTITKAAEARLGNRIYDDRDECYAQYIALVAIATRWEQNYNIKVKLCEEMKAQIATQEDMQQLTDDEFLVFQKQVKKLSNALKRWKTLVWILAGYGVAATAVAAAGLAL